MTALRLGLICALLASQGLAQDVVGTTTLDGERVELLSDFSWRYVEESAAADACLPVTVRVSFCGDPNTWQQTALDNSDVAASFRHDDRHYAQYIVEDFGTDDGLTLELMKEIVIDNAASAAGQAPEDIAVISATPTDVNGQPGETLVYVGEIDGFSFVFANTIVLKPKLSLQAITFAVTDAYTPKHAGLQAALIAATRIDGE